MVKNGKTYSQESSKIRIQNMNEEPCKFYQLKGKAKVEIKRESTAGKWNVREKSEQREKAATLNADRFVSMLIEKPKSEELRGSLFPEGIKMRNVEVKFLQMPFETCRFSRND